MARIFTKINEIPRQKKRERHKIPLMNIPLSGVPSSISWYYISLRGRDSHATVKCTRVSACFNPIKLNCSVDQNSIEKCHSDLNSWGLHTRVYQELTSERNHYHAEDFNLANFSTDKSKKVSTPDFSYKIAITILKTNFDENSVILIEHQASLSPNNIYLIPQCSISPSFLRENSQSFKGIRVGTGHRSSKIFLIRISPNVELNGLLKWYKSAISRDSTLYVLQTFSASNWVPMKPIGVGKFPEPPEGLILPPYEFRSQCTKALDWDFILVPVDFHITGNLLDSVSWHGLLSMILRQNFSYHSLVNPYCIDY